MFLYVLYVVGFYHVSFKQLPTCAMSQFDNRHTGHCYDCTKPFRLPLLVATNPAKDILRKSVDPPPSPLPLPPLLRLPPEQCLKEYHYDCKKRLSKNSTVCLIHCCDNTDDCNGGTSRQRNLVADMLPGIRDANEFESPFLRTRCRTTVYYVKFITCYDCIPLQLFRSAV